MLKNRLRRWLGIEGVENDLLAISEVVDGHTEAMAERTKELAEWMEARQQLDRILKRFQAQNQHDASKQDDPMARARARVVELKQGRP